MASFSIINVGPYEATFNVTGIPVGYEVWFFVRLTSDTSDKTDENTIYATSSSATFTTYKLAPSTSYTFNVRIGGTTWIGPQTYTTPPEATVSVSSVTDTSVTALFSNLKSGTTYSVYIGPTAAGSTAGTTHTTFTATSSSVTKTYSGLVSDTAYEISISVYGTSTARYAQFTTDTAVPIITWSLSSSALGALSDAYSDSYSFGAYVLRRVSVVFASDGTATFYTTGGADTVGYLSTSTGYDNSSGIPTSYVAYDDDSGDGNNCSISYAVTAGTTYYFWVRMYNGANTGTVIICIDPPPRPTDRIGSGEQYKRGIFWIGDGGQWHKTKRWIGDGGAWK